LLAALLLVRCRYLIVLPRPLPAALLDARRTYLIVAPRPVSRPVLEATLRCRSRRRSLGS
jgi:hypothetical protein